MHVAQIHPIGIKETQGDFMLRTSRQRNLIVVIITALLLASIALGSVLALQARSAQASAGDKLAKVRVATARYKDLNQATANKYALFKDVNGITCIANTDDPSQGAMGIHYLNADLVGAVAKSGTFDPLKPQALVYESGDHDKLHLVALEYLVFQKDWEAKYGAGAALPKLFGQTFMLIPANNRFSPDAIYALHVWIWKDNPSGTFAMWNPTVHCSAA